MKDFKVGDKVRKSSGEMFSCGNEILTIEDVGFRLVKLSNGNYGSKNKLELVEGEKFSQGNEVKPNHYHKGGIDLFEFYKRQGRIEELKGFCQVSASKYVLRYKEKGGITDLKKAIECIKELIKLEDIENEWNYYER